MAMEGAGAVKDSSDGREAEGAMNADGVAVSGPRVGATLGPRGERKFRILRLLR